MGNVVADLLHFLHINKLLTFVSKARRDLATKVGTRAFTDAVEFGGDCVLARCRVHRPLSRGVLDVAFSQDLWPVLFPCFWSTDISPVLRNRLSLLFPSIVYDQKLILLNVTNGYEFLTRCLFGHLNNLALHLLVHRGDFLDLLEMVLVAFVGHFESILFVLIRRAIPI